MEWTDVTRPSFATAQTNSLEEELTGSFGDRPDTDLEEGPLASPTGGGAAAAAAAGAGREPGSDRDALSLSSQEHKRKRLAEQHNRSEQRRRQKINTKLEELQALVPYSRSREKAAILGDVIEYIKSLQAQLHVMSAILACDAPLSAPPLPPSSTAASPSSSPPNDYCCGAPGISSSSSLGASHAFPGLSASLGLPPLSPTGPFWGIPGLDSFSSRGRGGVGWSSSSAAEPCGLDDLPRLCADSLPGDAALLLHKMGLFKDAAGAPVFLEGDL